MTIEITRLLKNPLFNHMSPEIIQTLIPSKQQTLKHYAKGSLVVQEGEACSAVGFVLEGQLAIQHLTPSGEALTIKVFLENDTFAAALYALPSPVYPFTLTAQHESHVLWLTFDLIQSLLVADPTFNAKFIALLCKRVSQFKDKLQMMQSRTVRARLVIYLTTEHLRHKQPTFKLSHSRSEIAEIIGFARPSVSREFMHMTEDQLITISGRKVTLLRPELFSREGLDSDINGNEVI